MLAPLQRAAAGLRAKGAETEQQPCCRASLDRRGEGRSNWSRAADGSSGTLPRRQGTAMALCHTLLCGWEDVRAAFAAIFSTWKCIYICGFVALGSLPSPQVLLPLPARCEQHLYPVVTAAPGASCSVLPLTADVQRPRAAGQDVSCASSLGMARVGAPRPRSPPEAHGGLSQRRVPR